MHLWALALSGVSWGRDSLGGSVFVRSRTLRATELFPYIYLHRRTLQAYACDTTPIHIDEDRSERT